jgi:sugar phosphate isomerase/epimerase
MNAAGLGQRSYRLGTTSFIYPGGWLYNVERLAPSFDDIEILFFESQADAFPSLDECRQLLDCKRAFDLSYSVHAPLDASLASESESRRRLGVDSTARALEVASRLCPENHVLHVYLGDEERSPRPPLDIERWRERAFASLSELSQRVDVAARLCVEVLDYDFELLLPVVESLGLSIALDVGPLVRDGHDELSLLDRYLDRTRNIQWHGTEPGGRDPRAIAHHPPERRRALLAALDRQRYAGVLTLEVFRERDLASCLACLAEDRETGS